MSLEDFIINIYCWVDDHLNQIVNDNNLRKRGFQPKLSDAELIAMEIVGEFMHVDTDKGIWGYFVQHWKHFFPKIGSRSQFAKQAANLWAVKQKLHQISIETLGAKNDPVHIVDGFPIPICHFKRAKKCSRFREEADFGYCATKNEHYYGFKGHLVVDIHGAIASISISCATGSEREAVWELTEGMHGILLGDKGYLGTQLREDLYDERNIELVTPVRSNMEDPLESSWRKTLNKARRRVETTIGQLAQQFSIQKTWSKSLWSLTNRITRKVLSYNLGMMLNLEFNNERAQLSELIN